VVTGRCGVLASAKALEGLHEGIPAGVSAISLRELVGGLAEHCCREGWSGDCDHDASGHAAANSGADGGESLGNPGRAEAGEAGRADGGDGSGGSGDRTCGRAGPAGRTARSAQGRCRWLLRLGRDVGCGLSPANDHRQQFVRTISATTGHAATAAPIGPRPRPCVTFAASVAAMPGPAVTPRARAHAHRSALSRGQACSATHLRQRSAPRFTSRARKSARDAARAAWPT
jgi:hypothetical protein